MSAPTPAPPVPTASGSVPAASAVPAASSAFRHPLRGVPAGAVAPPADWSPHLKAELQVSRYRSLTSTDQILDVRARPWVSWNDLIELDNLDMADLHPLRCRAALRLVRWRMIQDQALKPSEPLWEKPLTLVLSYLPPRLPVGADPYTYEASEDKLLVAFCEGYQRLAVDNGMDHGTTDNSLLGLHQLNGLFSPEIARAAWPHVFELFTTEGAVIKEVSKRMGERGPLGTRLWLMDEWGAWGLEAEYIIQFVISQTEAAYDLTEDQQRALYLQRFDDVARRAAQEYSLTAEITALKAGAVVAGLGRTNSDTSIGQLIDAIQINLSIDDKDRDQALLPDRSNDPLLS